MQNIRDRLSRTESPGRGAAAAAGSTGGGDPRINARGGGDGAPGGAAIGGAASGGLAPCEGTFMNIITSCLIL